MRFRERGFVFPKTDVAPLSVDNTTAERLAECPRDLLGRAMLGGLMLAGGLAYPALADDTIKIGAPFNLTGALSSLDAPALNGAKLNYTSLESCIAAHALVAALKKAGPQATREGILQAMGSLGRLDLGGYSLQFSPARHHGSSWVELTMLSRGNRFVQ